MLTLILTDQTLLTGFETFAPDLWQQLQTSAEVKVYTTAAPDFSDVPELFNDQEKTLIYNQFAFEGGFEALTAVLPKTKNICYLFCPYSAYEGLDLEVVKQMGIRFRSNKGANAPSVAQYAITAMYMLLSKFPMFTRTMTMPSGETMGEELAGKTAAIIGLGNVGQHVLDTLQKLGVSTVYYSEHQKEVSAQAVSFEKVFEHDLLFLTLATNEKSMQLLSDFASKLQPNNYLIDVSATDTLYDKRSVLTLLNEDKLKGYALEIEHPESLEMKSDKNLLATPHIAWCTIDAERRTATNLLNRALQVAQGHRENIDFIV